MARRTYRAELANDAAWVWLLTIEWAGQTYRYASRPVSAVDPDGVSRLYLGGLSITDLEVAAGAVGGAADYLAIPVEVLWSGTRSVAQMVEDGHDISTATGELALWIEGTPLADRWPVLRGECWQPTYGDSEEPLSMTLRSTPLADGVHLPDARAVISPETWPDSVVYPERIDVGYHYPVVYGVPGQWLSTSATTITLPGAPAFVIESADGERADTLVVADRPSQIGRVTIYADGVAVGPAIDIDQTVDGAGRTIDTVDISTQTDDERKAGEYWASWATPSAETFTQRLGDVMLWLVRQSGVDLDYGRWATFAEQVNTIEVAGYIDEPTPIMQYIVDVLLPLVPASLIVSGSGVYPVLWQVSPTAAEAVQTLVEGRNAHRVSRVQYEWGAEQRASRIRIQYVEDGDRGDPRATQVLVPPEEWSSATLDVVPHPALRPGGVEMTIRPRVVWTRDAALAIGDWMARHYGRIPRTVEYECGQDVGAWLELGDVVTVTDEGLALDARPCVVESVRLRDGGMVTVGVVIGERSG